MSDDDPRDEAQAEETAIESPEPSPEAETEFNPFDEVEEDYKPASAVFVNGPDGLPMRMDHTQESDIPALSKTSLVCMGDYSKFVLRDRWGEIMATLDPKDVERAPDGRWRARPAIVIQAAEFWVAAIKKRLEVLKKEAPEGVEFNDSDNPLALILSARAKPGQVVEFELEWVEVFPVRPPCRHYVRQEGSFNLNAARKAYYRLCSARRTTEGTFMTVRDTGIWACDMRDPFDAASVKALDDFDEKKVKEGESREYLSIFESTSAAPTSPKESQ